MPSVLVTETVLSSSTLRFVLTLLYLIFFPPRLSVLPFSSVSVSRVSVPIYLPASKNKERWPDRG